MYKTTFSRVCTMNRLFGVGHTLDDMKRQMDLIREELEEVEEAFLSYRVALEHPELSSFEDTEQARDHLSAELADLRIVTDGMGYVIRRNIDIDTHAKMTTNMRKVMHKVDADVQVARYQGKGLSVAARQVDENSWVVISTVDQWLAHKHFPKGKILKRI